jgi:hypothetical protein
VVNPEAGEVVTGCHSGLARADHDDIDRVLHRGQGYDAARWIEQLVQVTIAGAWQRPPTRHATVPHGVEEQLMDLTLVHGPARAIEPTTTPA